LKSLFILTPALTSRPPISGKSNFFQVRFSFQPSFME